MTISKKVLSVALAVLMVLSCCAVAFAGAVDDLAARVNDFDVDAFDAEVAIMWEAGVDDALFNEAAAIIEAYKALSDAEVNAFPQVAFSTLKTIAYQYKAFKAYDDAGRPTGMDLWMGSFMDFYNEWAYESDKDEVALEILGRFPQTVDTAKVEALAARVNAFDVDAFDAEVAIMWEVGVDDALFNEAAAIIEAYKALSDAEVNAFPQVAFSTLKTIAYQYKAFKAYDDAGRPTGMDLWMGSFMDFYNEWAYESDKDEVALEILGRFPQEQKDLVEEVKKATTWEELLTALEGADDDAIIVAGDTGEEYSLNSKSFWVGAVAYGLLTKEGYTPAEALALIAERVSAYAYVSEIYSAALEIIDAKDIDRAVELIAQYEALKQDQKNAFTSIRQTSVIDQVRHLAALVEVEAFAAYVEAATAPYSNEVIQEAKVLREKITDSIYNAVTDEEIENFSAIKAKYLEILDAVTREPAADNEVDASAFEKTSDKGFVITNDSAKNIVSTLDAFVDIDTLIADLLNGKVLTGGAVITAYNAISNLLEEKAGGLSSALVSVDLLIDNFGTDAKFTPVVEKLRAGKAKGYTKLQQFVDDPEVIFTSEDFGFVDGDADGFIDALATSLSNVVPVLEGIQQFGKFTDSKVNGEFKTGRYDALVPLFEILELNPVSVAEYTEIVNAEVADGVNRGRAVLRVALAPVGTLLKNAQKAPLDTIVYELPLLAYALENGIVNDSVKALVKGVNILGNDVEALLGDVSIDKDLIWGILEENLVNDGPQVPLTKDQYDDLFEKLAHAADASVKPSVSAVNKNRLALKPDTKLVYGVVANALLDFYKTEEGKAFVENVLENVDNDLVRSAVRIVVGLLSTNIGKVVVTRNMDALTGFAAFIAKIVRIFRLILNGFKQIFHIG